jgi:eukaryotic-like serine/threonine-protein kinase
MGEQFGRYRLDDTLGQGGMGIVYRAWDSVLERVVALKMVLSSGDMDPDVRERFLREARSAAQLTHRNIVTIYDLGEQDGRLYLAMEFLDGEDLQHRLARTEKTSVWRKLTIAIEICQGIEFAHAHGVIHRDLKPGNIFVTASGGVKILDFGLARFMSSQLTQSNMLLGTMNYMSPEQVRGERADQQSDVFSIGVVLYELFGRRRAFEGDSAASTLYKILQEVPEPLWRIDAELPRELVAIIDRALAKPRDERYPDVASMRRDLELLQNVVGHHGPATPWPVAASHSDATLVTVASVPAAASSGPGVGPAAASASPVAIASASGSAAPGSSVSPGRSNGFWAGAGIGALAVAGLVVWLANRQPEPPLAAPASTALPAQARPSPEPVTPPPPAAVPETTAVASRGAVPAAPPAERRTAQQKRGASPPPHVEAPVTRAVSPVPEASRREVTPGPPPPPPIQAPAAAAQPASTPAAQPAPAPAVATPPAPVTSAPPTAPATSAPPPTPATSSAPAVSKPAAVEAPTLTAERAAELLQRYKASLEAKSLDQLKRLWPSLGGAPEAALRQEFQHATRISVGISDIQVSASAGSGRITFVRSYGLVTVDGQRPQSTSLATMDVHRTGDVWLIDSIQFTPR